MAKDLKEAKEKIKNLHSILHNLRACKTAKDFNEELVELDRVAKMAFVHADEMMPDLSIADTLSKWDREVLARTGGYIEEEDKGSRLSKEDLREIKILYNYGYDEKTIAKHYKVSRSEARRLKKNAT